MLLDNSGGGRDLADIFDDALAAAIPASDLTVSKWAETYRYLSAARSARPGKWSNDTVPFMTEVMDSVSDPAVRKVVLMKSSQVAGTEFLVNVFGYHIHIDPCPMIYCAEIEDKARAWTNEAFDPTVDVTPVLADRVRLDAADNNQRVKRFPGGQLTICWASSPAQLSSRPARVIGFDEVDGYEVTREGDAVKLGEARTKTFSGSEKILLVSSPRNKETSIIEPEFHAGDQREYYVPCPHCSEFQTLKWANCKWDDEPAAAYMVCEICGAVIEHEYKHDMLLKGRWVAGAPFKGTASFRINELYSPFTTWGSMATEFLEVRTNPVRLKVFVNTRLGETWEEQGEQINFADLKYKQDEYLAPVPHGVLFLTAGVDVQDDRLEIEVVGWGRDCESWSIDYRVIYGSPALPDVWDDLSDYLLTPREDEQGYGFPISAAAIDSGGHHTSRVYRFCKANSGRRWIAVKGANVSGKPIISKPSLVGPQKVRLFTVGTDVAKDEIYSFLRVPEPGSPGCCHFPADDRYDENYFKQLCAEKKITRFVQGVAKQVWIKITPSARNEALDCRVYATAARAFLNPNFERMASRRQRSVVSGQQLSEPGAATGLNTTDIDDAASDTEQKPKPRGRFRIKNSFAKGYKI